MFSVQHVHCPVASGFSTKDEFELVFETDDLEAYTNHTLKLPQVIQVAEFSFFNPASFVEFSHQWVQETVCLAFSSHLLVFLSQVQFFLGLERLIIIQLMQSSGFFPCQQVISVYNAQHNTFGHA